MSYLFKPAYVKLFLAVFLFSGCKESGSSGVSAPPPGYSATIAESRGAVQKSLEASGAAFMSVALTDGERVIWSEGFGVANPSTGQAPAPDTACCIGSVTKVITAAAVMKLVERGQVRLDDPLVKHLPTFSMTSPEYREITVRMLLNHASGLAGTDIRNAFTSAPFPGYAEQVQQTLRGERLKHKPGYMSVYCNDGFTLVEPLVQAVTGSSYAEFVRQEILGPLGMTHSRFAEKAQDLPPGSHACVAVDGKPITPEYVNAYATGGLYSTPADMSSFARMLINGGTVGSTRILARASIVEMATDQVRGSFDPHSSSLLRYGLGWDTVTHPGMKAVGVEGWTKNGGTMAYHSTLTVLPKERLSVVVFTDPSGSREINRLAEQILLRALVERGRLPAMPTALPPSNLPVCPAPPAEERAISGIYTHHAGRLRLSFAADHALAIERGAPDGAWEADTPALTRRTDGWYCADDAAKPQFLPVIGDGRRYLAQRSRAGLGHYFNSCVVAEKAAARPALNQAWQARTGTTFLLANAPRFDLFLEETGPASTFLTLPELPGYLFPSLSALGSFNASVDGLRAQMHLLIPQNFGRDLGDLSVASVAGEEWLRWRSVLLRPASGVPWLPLGSSTVTFGEGDLNEWRRLPGSGSVSMSGTAGWHLYDENFKLIDSGAGGTLHLSSGGTTYLRLSGSPASSVAITLTGA